MLLTHAAFRHALKATAVLCLLTASLSNALAAEYFVDQASGSAADTNPGTADRPWRSLYALNGRTFAPGDIISVRSGTYSMGTGGSWSMPAVNIGSSGTQSSPITIRSAVKHGAILDGGGKTANAPLGSSGRNWLVIDGFQIRNTGPKGIAIFNATGVTVQNCKISKVVWNTVPGDNTEGIRIEGSNQTMIRNNDISGIDSGQPGHWNGAGIKLYDSSNTIIENNYIHDYPGSGIYDKRGGNTNEYRFNLVENVTDAFGVSTEGGKTNSNIRFHNNIARNVQSILQEFNNITGDVHMYSNTFINFATMGMRVQSTASTHTFHSYNNIFVRTATLEPHMGEMVVMNPSQLSRSDYNVYASSSPRFVTHQYESTQAIYNGLSAWRSAFGGKYDSNSIVSAVSLDAATDYKLATTSLAGFARTGGVSSGTPIDPGAYSTGKEVIGLTDGASVRPAAPTGLSVQ